MKSARKMATTLLTLSAVAALSACSSKPVVGVLLPMTGEASTYGESMKRGIDIALEMEQDNLPSGFLVLWGDTESNPATGAAELQRGEIQFGLRAGVLTRRRGFLGRGRIPEEAVAVGICEALQDSDKITSTHRGHGHCVAKGAEFKQMFCELLGKEEGYCRGKGGSMHIADQSHGNLGANAIVGGSMAQIDEPTSRRWYPVIDFDRCTNCMECVDFCLFGVYGIDDDETILVELPDNCRKGCPACSRVCPEQAIIFPQHKTPAIAGASRASGKSYPSVCSGAC